MMDGSAEFEQYLHEVTPSEDFAKKKNRRALILFLMLVLVGGICLFAYFTSGKGWSIAATILDDTVGNMRSYTAVIFSGVGERDLDPANEERALLIADANVLGASADDPVFVQGPLNAEAGFDDASGRNIDKVAASSDLSGGLIQFDENGEIEYNNLGDQIMSIFYRAMAQIKTEDQSRVYVSDVSDLYQSAGAQVATINISDANYYSVPVVYSAGEKKIGVFSTSSYISKSKLVKIVSDIKNKGADIVICVAPRTAMVSSFDEIDTLIITEKASSESDDNKGDTMIIEAPSSGEVGIVLFSQNNTAYYKSIDEL